MTDLIHQSIKLRTDQVVKIKELKMNLSEWTRNKFDEDFMVEKIKEKMKGYGEKMKILKKYLNKQKENLIFSKENKKLLKECNKIIKKNETYFFLQLEIFNKETKKNLTYGEFREALNKYGG